MFLGALTIEKKMKNKKLKMKLENTFSLFLWVFFSQKELGLFFRFHFIFFQSIYTGCLITTTLSIDYIMDGLYTGETKRQTTDIIVYT